MTIDKAAKNVLLGRYCENCYHNIYNEKCDNPDNIKNHGPENESILIPQEKTCENWKEDTTRVLSQDEIDQLLSAISSNSDTHQDVEKKELTQEEVDELLSAATSTSPDEITVEEITSLMDAISRSQEEGD